MAGNLYVTLDFLHLENALFCAEQCIAADVSCIELSSLLLKNVGFSSIHIFQERFPQAKIIADLKILTSPSMELETVAQAGASGITVSAAITDQNWERCLDVARKHSLQLYFDFRGCTPTLLAQRIPIAEKADGIFLDWAADTRGMALLQQTISQISKPLFLHDVPCDENILQSLAPIPCTIALRFPEGKGQNFKEILQKFKSLLPPENNQGREHAHDYQEQLLREKLRQITPLHITEIAPSSCWIEKVYPLHRFTKIMGRASTIQVWPGNQKAVAQFLLEMPEENILVVDAQGQGGAVWGALTTEIALKRKILGALIYGAISDVNALRQKSFPCYTTAIAAFSSLQEGEARKNIPLSLGNVVVHPGDWLLGDDNGIVCIPAAQAFPLVDRAWHLATAKESILEEIALSQDLSHLRDSIDRYYLASQKL